MRLKHAILGLVAVLGMTQTAPAAASPDDDGPEMELVEKNVEGFPGSLPAAPSFTTTTTFELTGWRKVWQTVRHPLRWGRSQWAWVKAWRNLRARDIRLSFWTGRKLA